MKRMPARVNLYESKALRDVTGPVIRPGGLELTDAAAALCGLWPGARALDIGCGSGAAVGYLNDRRGVNAAGIDRSSLLLAEARQSHPRLPFIRGDAAHLPFSDDCFDAVFCECVLSLTRDPAAALGECRRVLIPGGRLILADIYLRADGSFCAVEKDAAGCCCLRGAVTRERLQRRIAAAGFTLRLWEDHSHLLKLLAARLVWTYGSMKQFWSCFYNEAEAAGMERTIKDVRPGYCLLAAEKEKRHG